MKQRGDLVTIGQLFYGPIWRVALVTGRWCGRAQADVQEYETKYWQIVSEIQHLNAQDALCRQVWTTAFLQGYREGRGSTRPAHP